MKAIKWYGYVTACRGSLLLGGTKHHESALFDTMEDANKWVSVIVATNAEFNRQVAAWGTASKEVSA